MNLSVSVVGLGQMGSAMAARVQEMGCDVRGWDTDVQARERAVSQHLQVAQSLRDAVADCDVVLSSLPNADAVRAAWLGADGITALVAQRTVCIDLSTIEPSAMKEVALAAAARGVSVLDCPVSGGPVEARSGKLVVMAGGDLQVIERVSPLLHCLGTTLMHTGAVGTAKVVKIVNNMMAMGNLLIASEAFSLGESAGVDPVCLYEVLAESGGRSQTFTKRFPHALRGDFEPRFKMELGEKDLALGLSLARSEGVPAPAAALVRELFVLALLEGHRGKDVVALLSMYRKWAEQGRGHTPDAATLKSSGATERSGRVE